MAAAWDRPRRTFPKLELRHIGVACSICKRVLKQDGSIGQTVGFEDSPGSFHSMSEADRAAMSAKWFVDQTESGRVHICPLCLNVKPERVSWFERFCLVLGWGCSYALRLGGLR